MGEERVAPNREYRIRRGDQSIRLPPAELRQRHDAHKGPTSIYESTSDPLRGANGLPKQIKWQYDEPSRLAELGRRAATIPRRLAQHVKQDAHDIQAAYRTVRENFYAQLTTAATDWNEKAGVAARATTHAVQGLQATTDDTAQHVKNAASTLAEALADRLQRWAIVQRGRLEERFDAAGDAFTQSFYDLAHTTPAVIVLEPQTISEARRIAEHEPEAYRAWSHPLEQHYVKRGEWQLNPQRPLEARVGERVRRAQRDVRVHMQRALRPVKNEFDEGVQAILRGTDPAALKLLYDDVTESPLTDLGHEPR